MEILYLASTWNQSSVTVSCCYFHYAKFFPIKTAWVIAFMNQSLKGTGTSSTVFEALECVMENRNLFLEIWKEVSIPTPVTL